VKEWVSGGRTDAEVQTSPQWWVWQGQGWADRHFLRAVVHHLLLLVSTAINLKMLCYAVFFKIFCYVIYV
jgi:hypothetical protein